MYKFIIFFLFLFNTNTLAKAAGDPGQGGGSGNEIGQNSGIVLSGGGYLNPLTGLPVYSTKVLRMHTNSGFNVDVDLHYSGANARKEVSQDNQLAPTGWCGLGWEMGYSNIYVDHKGTTTAEDDKYYYVHSNGVVSEIVKDMGTWRIKSDPFWSISPHYEPHAPGEHEIVDGWTVYKTDGSIFVYGDHGEPQNANRNIIAIGDNIGTTGAGTARKFYYCWDLKKAYDANGSQITFTYWQYIRTLNGQSYTGESHIEEIKAVDNGDRFEFFHNAKGINEGPSWISSSDFDFHEIVYLHSISYYGKDSRGIDHITFSYSGDAGQLSHLNSGVAGCEKRMLMGITSRLKMGNYYRFYNNGSVNRVFNYDCGTSFRGLINGINEPTIGKSVELTYSLQSIFYTENGTQHEYRFPVITTIKKFDGVNITPASITTYTYPTEAKKQRYIPSTGLGFWGEVKENSGTGDVVTIYEINPENHMFGTPINISMYNTNGVLKSQPKNMVESYKFTQPTEWFYNVITKSEHTEDGLTTTSGTPFCAFNAGNGLSSLSYQINSDGKAIVSKTGFAHETYIGMSIAQGSGQMSQAGATTIYEVPNFTPNCDFTNAKVVSATFTTWKPFDAKWTSGIIPYYRPYQTYAWKADAPVTAENFHPFDVNNPSANNWKLTASIEKYNNFGSVLDAAGPTGVHSAKIFRSDYNLAIAGIANARYLECAAFTCDYDLNVDGYFDKANGWEKCGSFINEFNISHFGTKSVEVILPAGSGKFGPSRNVAIFQGKDYILSAWVLVWSGTLELYGDYRWRVEDENLPITVSETKKSFSVSSAKANAALNWQYIELRIPASKDLSSADWATHALWATRVYVGSPIGVHAFIDDIRFYPADAMVNTTYYDMKWRMPRLSVDANNHPSLLSEYAYLGPSKATRLYKINKAKSYADDGFKKPIQSIENHFVGDVIRVLSPNGGEQLRAGAKYSIKWCVGTESLGSGLDVEFYDGTAWSYVITVEMENAYVWTVPSSAKTNCRIRVLSRDDPTKGDTSDNTFSIITNEPPSAPTIITPINSSEITSNTTLLSWNPSTDPDGGAVSYRIEARRAGEPWTTFADNYGSTQYPLTTHGYGVYEFRITANDGSLSSSTNGQFYYMNPTLFVIRDISDSLISCIPSDLYTEIYNTLSSDKQQKFANTYSNTTVINGYNAFAEAANYRSMIKHESESHALNNFYYSIWTLKDNKWLKGVWEGDGVGNTSLSGGDGCGLTDGETRCIIVVPNIPNPPAMTMTYNWECPNSGSKTLSWNQEVWTGQRDNAIMNLKWTTVSGYHTWYKAWHRGAGDSGWKSDGEWTSNGNHKLDKVWLRMYKYNP